MVMDVAVKEFDFPEDAVFELTHGDCWLLAASLKNATGLSYAPVYGDGEIHHVGIELPDGKIVDVEGIWEADVWERRWIDELQEVWEVYVGGGEIASGEGSPILHSYDPSIESCDFGGLKLSEIRDAIIEDIASL